MTELKQVLVIDENLDMSQGKAISQAAHASLKAYIQADGGVQNQWLNQGGKKVALSSGDRDVRDLYEEANRNELPASLVRDAGHTEVEPGTVTALGIGPAEENRIDEITGELKLIK